MEIVNKSPSLSDDEKRPVSPDSQSETSKLVKKTTTFSPEVIEVAPSYEPLHDDTCIEIDPSGRFNVKTVGLQSPTTPSSPTHDTITSNQMTTDFLQPNSVYYRLTDPVPRPPIHSVDGYKQTDPNIRDDLIDSKPINPLKFGWIIGVLVRCILNIWGVMLFLRLSYIVGQAGVGYTLLIILLSSLVTLLTTSSMSAICTNGQVRGGGAYYLISRSLGPEFGGAIGLIFSLANAVAVAMYIVGFSETVVDLMIQSDVTIFGNSVHDTRLIGAITLLLLLGITQLGMAWESKTQLVLLVILIISIINFLIGTFLPPNKSDQSMGFFGYSTTLLQENFGPSYRDGESFFSLFSIFFPAATGILAGCNISGDLKDAQTAIPKGTFLAILITSVTYGFVAIILGAVEVRDASGDINNFVGIGNPILANCSSAACSFGWSYEEAVNCTIVPEIKCFKGGLFNDYQAMQKISAVSQIIVAGIFAATLSSALASLVSAPKIFQAVCKDKIFPAFSWFGVGAKKSDEPQRAYLLAFFISMGFVLIGELNVIAPIISNFFLASYTLINYSCFSSSLSNSPGWRPAYKYYNMWLSLFGAFVCCAIMFVIKWWAALITIVIVIIVYKYVDVKKPNINWGSSTQAIVYTQALNQVLKLNSVEDHVRNFRPQLLVLTGCASHRPALIHVASSMTKNSSLMVCGSVTVGGGKYPFEEIKEQQEWLNQQKVKAFYACVSSSSLKSGVQSLMESAGLGKMKTNTLLIGFKTDWQSVSNEELTEYCGIIKNAFDMKFGVLILRMKSGLDISEYLEDRKELMGQSKNVVTTAFKTTITEAAKGDASFSAEQQQVRVNVNNENLRDLSQLDVAKVKASTQLQSKPEKGKTIDVWWLTEDGGLTVLLPHIISNRQQWCGCKLRIFTIRSDKSNENDYSMARLMSKFRIDCEDITIIEDIKSPPSEDSVNNFYSLIQSCRQTDVVNDSSKESGLITDGELEKKKSKTLRHIRLQELLQKHSKDAALIFITLPLPKDIRSPALYLAWLDEITKNLPPIVLIRGNQTSVLTFYS